MGSIFCAETSVRNYRSTTGKFPKYHRAHVFIIFDAIFYACPNQYVANGTMGTAAKELGHGQPFKPCTHMSPLRHAVWRIQTKLTLRAGHRMCTTVLCKSIVLSEIWELVLIINVTVLVKLFNLAFKLLLQ